MKRKYGMLLVLLGVISFFIACTSPWKVIRQAVPNPFLGANPHFFVTEIVYENLQVGNISEDEYLSRKKAIQQQHWKEDKIFLSSHFMNGLKRNGEELSFRFKGEPKKDEFVIQPIVNFLEPGFYAVVQRPTEVRMRVLILRDKQVVDEIFIHILTNATGGVCFIKNGRRYKKKSNGFSVGGFRIPTKGTVRGRLKKSGDFLGKWVAQYLQKRLKDKK